ncbi:MAG: DUF481 domain-containing protein [Elusimicrobiaceae bacterium]
MKFIIFAGLLAAASSPAGAQAARTDDQRQTPPELWTSVEKQKLEIFANASRLTGNVDSSSFGGSLRYALKINPANSLFVEGASAYSAFNGSTQLEKSRISALYAYALSPSVNAYVWTAHAQNKFLNLHYRTTNGTGLCLHGFGGKIFDPILLSAGVAPEYELYYGGTQNRKFRANGRVVFRIPVGDFMTIGEDFIYFASFNNFSDYRIYNETYAELAITEKLSYRITATDEYDSRPFSGVKNNDFTLAQGLVVHLGK